MKHKYTTEEKRKALAFCLNEKDWNSEFWDQFTGGWNPRACFRDFSDMYVYHSHAEEWSDEQVSERFAENWPWLKLRKKWWFTEEETNV